MRARLRTVVALALVLPALFGIAAAFRLAAAGWQLGVAGGDPILFRWFGDDAGDLGERLELAAETAPLDFRYPFRRAEAIRLAGFGRQGISAEFLTAQELYRESVRLAPTFPEARYRYALFCFEGADPEEADRQVASAFRLAPLNPEIRAKVATYFAARYRATLSRPHLRAAVRAMGPSLDEPVRELLGNPLLSYQEVRDALTGGELDPAELVRVLGRAGRWSWAVRMAAEVESEDTSLLGETRLGYAEWLLDMSAVEAGRKEAEEARSLLGDGFTGWLVLAAARLRSGADAEGGAALEEALARGESLANVDRTLRLKGVAASARIGFWRNHGVDEPLARLMLGRALVSAGESSEAHAVLLEIGDEPDVGAEANFQLAVLLEKSRNLKLALRHAEAAVAREEENPRYRKLLDRLRKQGR